MSCYCWLSTKNLSKKLTTSIVYRQKNVPFISKNFAMFQLRNQLYHMEYFKKLTAAVKFCK